ncbi:hypothetical protein [Thiomicrorhabdus sp.]|uniref:hypothetical protein n=1 Tax=Thiomicrorhabdus sp. TaxID=2039724 RepID=UPI002AA76FE9|nr:hypothetical protein [Thiomicrorhabdus sp.]
MEDLMEYMFFDEALAKRFQTYCENLGVATELVVDITHTDDDSFTIKIADGLDDTLMEKIEEEYGDMLFGEQAAQVEGNDDGGAIADACGVQVQLSSGQFTTVAIHPEIMNKILSVLTIDELQQFLSQVAEDIENPKMGPICSRESLPTI